MSPFNERIYNRLSTIFEKILGSTLSMPQMERLQTECQALANEITQQINTVSQAKALEVCKLLNDATKAGFIAVSADVQLLKKKTNSCESPSSDRSTEE